MNCKSYW